VADHTKFSRRPMVRAGSISEVSVLFTDQPPPAQISELLKAHDKKIYVADEQ
jgi:DeoR family glycerol-3-phosphate regulon repressor